MSALGFFCCEGGFVQTLSAFYALTGMVFLHYQKNPNFVACAAQSKKSRAPVGII